MHPEIASNKPDKDINDIFDEILFTEENIIQSGYDSGLAKGSSDGNPEGYHLGYHRGAELGSELGYYLGIAQIYLNKDITEKIRKNLDLLKNLIDNFPRTNVEDFDIIQEADKIRTLFKKICALLKIDLAYSEIDKLSF